MAARGDNETDAINNSLRALATLLGLPTITGLAAATFGRGIWETRTG